MGHSQDSCPKGTGSDMDTDNDTDDDSATEETKEEREAAARKYVSTAYVVNLPYP